MQKIRKAVIPAAGLGTRVLPATKAMPKEMLPIVDKPAIQYIVEEAVAAGIEQQVLAVVDDQELVGLDPFAADEVIETQALVAAVVEQHDRFASHGR